MEIVRKLGRAENNRSQKDKTQNILEISAKVIHYLCYKHVGERVTIGEIGEVTIGETL